MATNPTYDVIVLGMGVVGSATAYHLAQAGQRVLALEQFDLDHKQGSSYGVSRIIRYAYEHQAYVEMAKAAYPMWRQLEQEAGITLMHQTGGLDFGKHDSASLIATRDSLRQAGIACEWLSPTEVARRFPQFRLEDDMMGLYQIDSGYLMASECVKAQARLAEQHGATVHTQTHVTGIEIHSDSVSVQTATDHYSAARLVIAAGAWAGLLLDRMGLGVPLQPTREGLIFFEPADNTAFMPDRFPVYISHGDTWFYGIPSVNGSGLKAAVHGRNHATDPDHTGREVEPEYVDQVRHFLQRHIPRANGKVKESRACLYTMTPDHHFIIDQHPTHPHVIIGAGFSGHGFKFGILTGQMLADLATQGNTSHDISLFSVSRFL